MKEIMYLIGMNFLIKIVCNREDLDYRKLKFVCIESDNTTK